MSDSNTKATPTKEKAELSSGTTWSNVYVRVPLLGGGVGFLNIGHFDHTNHAADGGLCVDALNTYTATGMTPSELAGRVKKLEKVLQTVADWKDFPPTNATWQDGMQLSYGALVGTNGERDYMRSVAKAALSKSNGGAE